MTRTWLVVWEAYLAGMAVTAASLTRRSQASWEAVDTKDRLLREGQSASPNLNEKAVKRRVKMKAVLEALGADVDDDETAKRLAKLKKHISKKKKEETDVRMDPSEILAILPHLSKEEKKRLLKELKAEAEEEAYRQLPKGYPGPKSQAAPERRSSGSASSSAAATAAAPLVEPRSESATAGAQEEGGGVSTRRVPKPPDQEGQADAV